MKIKLMEGGQLPKYIHKGDACADCYSAEEVTIPAGERKLVRLGFALAIPTDYEVVLRPRSGLTKRGIDSCIGTIDSGYRGELMACLVNNTKEPFFVKRGDRICQMKYQTAKQCSFETVEELDETERGENGFGSSGIRD